MSTGADLDSMLVVTQVLKISGVEPV